MKCPNCGAEVKGTVCEFCDSDLTHLMPAGSAAGRENEDDEITDEMIEEIKKLCAKFQREYPDEFSCYDAKGNLIAGPGVKDRLFDVLDIADDCAIFLIHDDTIMHSGKNGFAITEEGFHCQSNVDELMVTEFEEIDEDDEANYDMCNVFLEEDETDLCYFTGSEEIREALCDLCDDIIDILWNAE